MPNRNTHNLYAENSEPADTQGLPYTQEGLDYDPYGDPSDSAFGPRVRKPYPKSGVPKRRLVTKGKDNPPILSYRRMIKQLLRIEMFPPIVLFSI